MIKNKLKQLEKHFLLYIQTLEAEKIPTETWGWDNHRFKSDLFRYCHVEYYEQKGLTVFHVTCFPHKDDKSPIFGFDIVANSKTDKVMAVFLDLSPVLSNVPFGEDITWKNPKKIPDWGNIFSDYFIAITPTKTEVDMVLNYGFELFKYFISILESGKKKVTDSDIINLIVKKQNQYCENQHKNKRTMGALKQKLGQDRANEFMKTILFPKILTNREIGLTYENN